MFLFFITSGLFLGWSLGANDAANIFGSAVGSRMLSFRKAAIIASIFVIVGAVVQGAGASETLGKLGSINALAGAFVVALSAALCVYFMTKYRLPVSTSQAIVGAIVGWNLYNGLATDLKILGKIVGTWFFSPVLGGVFAILLLWILKFAIRKSSVHLVKLDVLLRIGLILVGAFGAYSLGANNIANVMGVFVSSFSLPEIEFGFFSLNGTQVLFLLGGIAIALGIITYSRKIMETVGSGLMQLTSESALVVVLAQAMVLFVFSSKELSNLFVSMGLPAIPLVPVSSSQAIIGAVLGIGLLKGGREINMKILGEIGLGWIITPVAAAIVSWLLLFFMENVFQQTVYFEENVKQVQEYGVKSLHIKDYVPWLWLLILILSTGSLWFYFQSRANHLQRILKIHKQGLEEESAKQEILNSNLKYIEEKNLLLNQKTNKLEKELRYVSTKQRNLRNYIEENKEVFTEDQLKDLQKMLSGQKRKKQ